MTKIQWLNAETSKPPVDETDDFLKKYGVTIEVLTYSKEYGKRIGRYHSIVGRWVPNGATGLGDANIPVTHYAFINDPEN